MQSDRLLNILRWVVTPIVLAIIAGYFQTRVNTVKEQTRASYDTLAPNVLQLQEQIAVLTGRTEELSRRPAPSPCPETPKAAGKTVAHVEAKPKQHTLEELFRAGKTQLSMDTEASAPVEAPQKVPAKFDDMIQQQSK